MTPSAPAEQVEGGWTLEREAAQGPHQKGPDKKGFGTKNPGNADATVATDSAGTVSTDDNGQSAAKKGKAVVGPAVALDTDSPLSKPYRGPFLVVLAAGFMTLLDVSIVNVALPSIESALNADSDELQWIVAGYALAFGLMLIISGRAGDIFGRKKLFLFGLTLFVLASLGCGLSPDGTWLMILRLVQGAAAGILNPQVLGFIQDMFKGKVRARALGMFGIIVGISTALGPVIGGSLIALAGAQHGWRLVFLINVPIGLVVIPVAMKVLPREKFTPDVPGSLLKNFDPVGLILLGLIVLGIMWPFLAASGEVHNPDAGTPPYWLLGISAALVVVLIFWESFWRKSGASALLEPTLYKSPSFVLGLTATFFYFGGFTSIFLVITLYLQQGRGWSALAAGLASVPFAVISGAASGVSGRLVNRFGRTIPLLGASSPRTRR